MLVMLARALAVHRGHTLSTISTYAANDGKFFAAFAAGKVKSMSQALSRRAESPPKDRVE